MDLLTLLIVICLVLWALGFFVVPVAGGAVHVLLVIVLVLVILRLARGQPML